MHIFDRIRKQTTSNNTDIAIASLLSGLTNVVTLRFDLLGSTSYEGIGGLHGGVGHGQVKNILDARRTICNFQFRQIAKIAQALKAIPEGDGTMADNTVIVYFSDHGDRHHSPFYLWPMTVLGDAGRLFKTGRYIQFPGHKLRGNQTMGNFFLTLLHAAGDKRKTFGQPDLESPDYINQKSPLEQWMA